MPIRAPSTQSVVHVSLRLIVIKKMKNRKTQKTRLLIKFCKQRLLWDSCQNISGWRWGLVFRHSQLLQTSSMAAAAHTFLSFSSPPRLLVSPSSTLRFSFGGVSLNLHRRQSVSFSASSKKSLTVVSAAKKAVAVLKGNSDVEGVVTLTQEDTCPFSILILDV